MKKKKLPKHLRLEPYFPIISEQQAVVESWKIWEWISSQPDGTMKRDHPQYDTIAAYEVSCPLCNRFRDVWDAYCRRCPLAAHPYVSCYYDSSPFGVWEETLTASDAAKVRDAIAQIANDRGYPLPTPILSVAQVLWIKTRAWWIMYWWMVATPVWVVGSLWAIGYSVRYGGAHPLQCLMLMVALLISGIGLLRARRKSNELTGL